MHAEDGLPARVPGNLERIDDAVVMLVDDDELNIDMLHAHLQEAGYRRFVLCSEASDALELVRQHLPDLILLDLQMPGVSGLDILAAMRGDPALAGVAAVVVTASTDHGTRLQALTLGATDFLHKPVDPAELVLRLKNTLEARAWRERVARTDLVTGLPNLIAATERLQWAMKHGDRSGHSIALLQLAVDGFGEIQALGAGAGDALLQTLGQRLQGALREADFVAGTASTSAMVARDGIEAFTVVLPDMQQPEQALAVAQRLQRVVSASVACAGQEITPTCSIGVAVYPADARTPGDLLALARAALTQARRDGDGHLRCYAADMNARARHKLGLLAELRPAAGRGELFLLYQPKRDVRSNAIVGAEALLRWQHPQRGLISPGEFIPLAEESDLIVELGDWVLREVVGKLKAWKQAGWNLPRVSVNVSARQMRGDRLLRTLDEVLQADGELAGRLCLELTEGIMLSEAGSVGDLLLALRRRGVQLALDDFGTGYSCLSYLQRLPFDELKVDRSFVVALADGDAPLVTAIINMGHALGFRVVAEGVETEVQLQWLLKAGCDEYQGWLGSRPLPAEEFVRQLGRQDAG